MAEASASSAASVAPHGGPVAAFVDPSTLVGAAVIGAGFVLLGAILTWSTRRLLKDALRFDKSERIDEITLSFLTRLANLAIWLGLLTLYAHVVPALARVSTALLAGASLLSVIVGFAAQTTLGNLISGVSLVLYKPFRRGDRLQVTAPTPDQCETGTVKDISLGFTLIETDDGRELIIANSTMAQQTMIKLVEPAASGSKSPKPPAPGDSEGIGSTSR